MIYDPSRRARELRERIIETMSAGELEAYAKQSTGWENSMREYGRLSLGIWKVDVEVEFNRDRNGGVFYPIPLTAEVLKMLTNPGSPTLTVGDESFTIAHVVHHSGQAAANGYVFERIDER
jgi:hypothetical protein